MKAKNISLTLLAALALSGAGYGLYVMGVKRGASVADTGNTQAAAVSAAADLTGIAAGEAATRRHIKDGLKAGDVDSATGQRVLYYHDPMVPGKRFDAPAKSPFMDMMLVPVYSGGGGGGAGHGQPARAAKPGAAHHRGLTRHTHPRFAGHRQHRLERTRPVGDSGARSRFY